jgi:hypothetical protein
LPDYKGSTFHGVFGRALKNVVCALKQQDCKDCPLKSRCLYARVFETRIAVGSSGKHNAADVPHPYIIEPSLSPENRFEKNQNLVCSLVLFGQVNHELPYFIYSFDLMGKTGLGRRVNGRRGQFSLVRVQSGDKVVYNKQDERIDLDGCAFPLSVESKNNRGRGNVSLCFLTPLRVKYRQRFAKELPFHVLTRAMLRRISVLMSAYGDGEPALDYRGLVEKAQLVTTAESELKWYDWERYSFRQRKKMPMGGLAGRISYENVPSEFLPVLDFCQKVHIGKNTSFGLGKFTAETHGFEKQQ